MCLLRGTVNVNSAL